MNKKNTVSSQFTPGLFSVIVPTYNRARLICETLNSIRIQTYRPIEVIIVDDGSTDKTIQVVKKWASAYEEPGLKIKYFCQDNKGPGAARNRGISEISGEFIQYLDSDDKLYPERLKILVKTFQKTNADFIHTGFERFDADTGEIVFVKKGWPENNQLELALYGTLFANTLRSAFKRTLIEKIGLWDTSMKYFEDREYVQRAIMQAEKSIAIRQVLASARKGANAQLSKGLRSYEGRICRIQCEKSLAEHIRHRKDVSYKAKQAFASRLYGLGLRSNASGWPELGKRCGEIAASIGVQLDSKGKIRKLIWRSGKIGTLIYIACGKLKRAL